MNICFYILQIFNLYFISNFCFSQSNKNNIVCFLIIFIPITDLDCTCKIISKFSIFYLRLYEEDDQMC